MSWEAAAVPFRTDNIDLTKNKSKQQ